MTFSPRIVCIRDGDPASALEAAYAVRDRGDVPLIGDDRWSDNHWRSLRDRFDGVAAPSDAAWGTFTSGSTGAPRVVLRSHSSWHASFDAVTHGYLMRNITDLPRALSEQFRVLRPGGRVVALETSPPPPGITRPFTNAYIKVIFPALGRLFGSDPEAYAYLSSTTRGFHSPAEVTDMLLDAGFVDVRVRTFMFGTLAVHSARKPRAAA